MPLVTSATIAARLPSLNQDQIAVLDTVAQSASDIVEDWCRRVFAVTSYTETMFPTGGVLLPLKYPIVTITSVQDEDGVDVDFKRRDTAAGLVELDEFVNGEVTVVYSAGYATIPSAVTEAVISVAAFLLNHLEAQITAAQDVRKRKLGDREIEFGRSFGDKASPITPVAKALLAPYRVAVME